jgi:HlyD family secretion protein/adhesin transport system membrane fusion protein
MYKERQWNYYILIVPIILFLVSFFTWATVSAIDEVVRGEGTVIPSGKTKIIQHLEGGIISEILVQEGDHVKKNDVLFKLSSAFFDAEYEENSLYLLALEAKQIRLNAQIKKASTVSFPSPMHQKIPEVVMNESSIFRSEQRHLEERIAILKDKVKQKKFELLVKKNQFKNLIIELQLARESLNVLTVLYKKGAASKREYLSELSKKQELVTKISNVKNSMPKIVEEIEEAEKKAKAINSEEKSKLLKELNRVNVESNKIKSKVKANVDREQRESIVSPVNGTVKKLYFYTEGGILKPGDKLVEVTPADDGLMIEAKIKTSDRAQVWLGQSVSIEITAYDFSKYGLLEGELVYISPDSFYDQKGNSYYIVRVKSNNFEFAPELPILPGMVANINILTGSKTILEYLIKPLKDIAKNSLREK